MVRGVNPHLSRERLGALGIALVGHERVVVRVQVHFHRQHVAVVEPRVEVHARLFADGSADERFGQLVANLAAQGLLVGVDGGEGTGCCAQRDFPRPGRRPGVRHRIEVVTDGFFRSFELALWRHLEQLSVRLRHEGGAPVLDRVVVFREAVQVHEGQRGFIVLQPHQPRRPLVLRRRRPEQVNEAVGRREADSCFATGAHCRGVRGGNHGGVAGKRLIADDALVDDAQQGSLDGRRCRRELIEEEHALATAAHVVGAWIVDVVLQLANPLGRVVDQRGFRDRFSVGVFFLVSTRVDDGLVVRDRRAQEIFRLADGREHRLDEPGRKFTRLRLGHAVEHFHDLVDARGLGDTGHSPKQHGKAQRPVGTADARRLHADREELENLRLVFGLRTSSICRHFAHFFDHDALPSVENSQRDQDAPPFYFFETQAGGMRIPHQLVVGIHDHVPEPAWALATGQPEQRRCVGALRVNDRGPRAFPFDPEQVERFCQPTAEHALATFHHRVEHLVVEPTLFSGGTNVRDVSDVEVQERRDGCFNAVSVRTAGPRLVDTAFDEESNIVVLFHVPDNSTRVGALLEVRVRAREGRFILGRYSWVGYFRYFTGQGWVFVPINHMAASTPFEKTSSVSCLSFRRAQLFHQRNPRANEQPLQLNFTMFSSTRQQTSPSSDASQSPI